MKELSQQNVGDSAQVFDLKININNEPPPHREIYFILQPAAQLMMLTLLEKYDAF